MGSQPNIAPEIGARMLDDLKQAMVALDVLLKRAEPILGMPGKRQWVEPGAEDIQALRLARAALWQIGELPEEQRAMSLRELTSLQHECASKAEYYRISGNPTLAERFELANRYACNALTFIQVALEYEVEENGRSRFEEWLSHRDEKL
ncbi:MAG: hypothetical protein K2X00_20690 [Nitrospiraceae bacterium]|nr:hypothetical protein [Nitrospiraceae bacterium]